MRKCLGPWLVATAVLAMTLLFATRLGSGWWDGAVGGAEAGVPASTWACSNPGLDPTNCVNPKECDTYDECMACCKETGNSVLECNTAICSLDKKSVGGIQELPNAAEIPTARSASSDLPYAALAGGLAAAVVAIAAGAWYARRRWLR